MIVWISFFFFLQISIVFLLYIFCSSLDACLIICLQITSVYVFTQISQFHKFLFFLLLTSICCFSLRQWHTGGHLLDDDRKFAGGNFFGTDECRFKKNHFVERGPVSYIIIYILYPAYWTLFATATHENCKIEKYINAPTRKKER